MSPRGRVSQTKYFLSNVPAKITVIRRHHPLQGRELEVLSAGKADLVVRLADGSSMKLPRRWTDADGMRQGEALGGDSKFCLAGLRALLRLVEALQRRATSSRDACGEIDAPHDIEGDINAQAVVARAHRAGEHRGAVGGVSRAGAQGAHAAVRAVDGAAARRAGAAGEGGGR